MSSAVESKAELCERVGVEMQEFYTNSIEFWITCAAANIQAGKDYDRQLKELRNSLNRYDEWTAYRFFGVLEVKHG